MNVRTLEQLRLMREIAKHGTAMDADEKAEYDSQRAREMARAEARRNPHPQLELDQAA